MRFLSSIRKALLAASVAGVGAVQLALPHGVSLAEWESAAVVAVLAGLGVYAVPNRDQPAPVDQGADLRELGPLTAGSPDPYGAP